MMKTCTKCGEVKQLEEFPPRANSSQGRRAQCRECVRRDDNARYARDPERRKGTQAAYKARNREAVSARNIAYYQANREQRIAKSRDFYAANRERRIAVVLAYAKAHPERRNSVHQRRRARLRGAGQIEKVRLDYLIDRDGGRCQICGRTKGRERWSIDHILPLSLGGNHTYANTRLTHLNCNTRRNNRGAAQLRLVG